MAKDMLYGYIQLIKERKIRKHKDFSAFNLEDQCTKNLLLDIIYLTPEFAKLFIQT